MQIDGFDNSMERSGMTHEEYVEYLQHCVLMLREEIGTLRTRCYPGAEKAFDLKMYGLIKIVPLNYKAKKE